MKKKALSFFLALVLVVTLLVPMASAEIVTNVKIDNVQGNASKLVEVKISMATNMDVTIGRLFIKYDPRLELVSFTNGTVFENTYSAVTGEESGEFIYVGDIGLTSEKESTSAKSGDVILTLKLRIPENASTADEYSVSLDTKSSFATSASAVSTDTPIISNAGTISVASLPECSAHTFGEETVVRTKSYFTGGYSYKSCSACGFVSATSTEPTATNVFTPIGTAIRYAGNPSGIGAHFKVNAESLQAIEALGYKVELGIELVYGDRTKTEVFYGDNTPEDNRQNYSDGVISASIEGIKTQLKGNIYAYVKIIDETGVARVEKTYTSISGSKDVSIADVVNLLNFNKYSPASKEYLNAVANGFEVDE